MTDSLSEQTAIKTLAYAHKITYGFLGSELLDRHKQLKITFYKWPPTTYEKRACFVGLLNYVLSLEASKQQNQHRPLSTALL